MEQSEGLMDTVASIVVTNKFRYKLPIEPDQRLKFECRETMSISCIIFIISQTHATGCDFIASIFYFYIETIF